MASKDAAKPNIIFILTDDQGPWAMGCAGNHEIITPNLDRLAESGVRFDHFFCTSPVCSPARASILTGKIPSQHGVHDFIKEGNCGESPIEYLAGHTAYTEILASHGYCCGLSGKWHLGDSAAPQKGFTHWYAHQSGSGPYYGAPMIRDGQPVREDGYITDVITDDALSFLDRSAQDGHPFYLSVHYTAPHHPWTNGEHPQELLDLYRDCPFDSCPQHFVHPDAVYQYEKKHIRDCLQGYFAAVTGVDRNVGRLLDKLDELGIRNDTLIVFMSDNGFNCGHHGIWGKGNGTFSLNMFDTSVKVPAIFSHPGRIPGSRVSSELLSQYDVMPTLLEYTGLSDPNGGKLPGSSFCPMLLGQSGLERDSVYVYDEYGAVRMVRSRDWKYVHRYPFGPHELYDLTNDPDESVNLHLQPEYEPILTQMRAELEEWFVRYADPMLDGSRLPVRGNGQLRLAGVYSNGEQAFDQNRTLSHSPVRG
jgi:choline-sulfatase